MTARPGDATSGEATAARCGAGLLAYAVLFFLAGRFGYWSPNRPHELAVVWLPTGLQIAALLAARPWCWPALTAVSMALSAWNSLLAGRPQWLAVQFALENAILALGSATLLVRVTRGDLNVDTVRGATAAVVIPAAVSAGAGALIRVLLHALVGAGGFERYWVFWGGSAAGTALVVPAYLAWRARRRRAVARPPRPAELAALAVAHAAALAAIASWRIDAGVLALLPAVLWSAARFGPRGVTASGAAALAGTLLDLARPDSAATELGAQVSLLILVVTGVVVAAAFEERRAGVAQLEESRDLLRDERERLAVTLRSIGDGVIATDVDGRVSLLNGAAEAITGWTQADAAGRPIAEVFRADPGAAGAGGATAPARPSSADPVALRARDGTERVVERTDAPILDGRGEVLGSVLVFRDVTLTRRREEALARAQRIESLAVLAGGIAHDFNNLLAGIQINLDVARQAALPPRERDEVLADAEAATVRAAALTQQLLTFARGGAPVKRVCDLGPTIREAAEFCVHGSRATCRFDLAPDLWPAEVDPGQIAQVVQNLVLNAIAAMPGGGRVLVAATNELMATGRGGSLAPGPYVRIDVTDEGVGIPDDVLPRIFDPFFTTKAQGSGLGLAVCQSIVSRHGGVIDARSARGVGTTFEVLLPATPAARAAAGARPAGSARPCRGRLLVMDDEELLRRATARIFASLGCEVATAADGAEAVELYRAAREAGRPFDAVVLDVTVPGGVGGVEALSRLRAVDPDVRAVVSSGYSSDPVMADHRAHGFAAVLVKPYGKAEAERAIAPLLPPRASAASS